MNAGTLGGVLLSVLSLVLALPASAGASMVDTEVELKIRDLLSAGEFKDAEKLTKKALAREPRDLTLLSFYETALASRGQVKKAKKVAAAFEKVVKELEREEKPIPAKRLRLVRVTERESIHAFEYVQPDDKRVTGITDYYFFQVRPKGEGETRRFYLEMSNLLRKFHVLRELFDNGGAQLKHYGDQLPALDSVVDDLVTILAPKDSDKPEEKKPLALAGR